MFPECTSAWVSVFITVSHTFFKALFLLFVLPYFSVLGFILPYYTTLYFFLSLRSLSFLMGDREGMDLDRRGCEGAAGGETVIMYIMQGKNSVKGERERERPSERERLLHPLLRNHCVRGAERL